MSTSYRRGDVVRHRDTHELGTVIADTDAIGLTVIDWGRWSSTVPSVDLLAASAPYPRRGDVVQLHRTDDRGTVTVIDGKPGHETTTVYVRRWSDGVTVADHGDRMSIVRRRRYSPAIDAMIDGWDGGDVWGSAMSMAWAVAEVARAAGDPPAEDVRTTLEVSWGAAQPMTIDEMADVDPDDRGDISFESETLADAYRDGRVTDTDLLFAARVLDRYLDICRAAGLDY